MSVSFFSKLWWCPYFGGKTRDSNSLNSLFFAEFELEKQISEPDLENSWLSFELIRNLTKVAWTIRNLTKVAWTIRNLTKVAWTYPKHDESCLNYPKLDESCLNLSETWRKLLELIRNLTKVAWTIRNLTKVVWTYPKLDESCLNLSETWRKLLELSLNPRKIAWTQHKFGENEKLVLEFACKFLVISSSVKSIVRSSGKSTMCQFTYALVLVQLRSF